MVADRNYTKKVKNKNNLFCCSPANSNLIGVTKNCKGWYESYSDVTTGTGIYLTLSVRHVFETSCLQGGQFWLIRARSVLLR